MLEVSESALKELDEYFVDKEKAPIRIYLAPGGCSGPRLALALDEPGDGDEVFAQVNHTFCMNKDLLEKTGAVKIDLSYMGFSVESANPIGGGGGCAGCASSGGCGGDEQ